MVVGYMITTQNSVLFLYTRNEQSKDELRKQFYVH